jgi:hypothetical protein
MPPEKPDPEFRARTHQRQADQDRTLLESDLIHEAYFDAFGSDVALDASSPQD